MKTSAVKFLAIVSIMVLFSVTVFELNAHARAGGGRSSGSRGSRSYSSPTQSNPQPTPSRQQAAPVSPQPAQPGGGLLRSIGGGIVGGLIGGMLFRSLGFGGTGSGFGGGGIGLFEIILVAGIGYFIYRMVKRNREQRMAYQQAPSSLGSYETGSIPQEGNSGNPFPGAAADSLDEGLAHIRQMDPSFDIARFNDTATDTFFKIQGAWMNRDISAMTGLLTDEMRGIFKEDIDSHLKGKKINRLENIAVRQVEPVEIWQEFGKDFVTVRFYANLLDYTTDDTTGTVISGSKTEPVKFEEYWTFTRPVGNNPWMLSEIAQP
ncbi:MAG: Tim44 domain-containing protein [Thermodesulfovibrio sp.]|nr:Tim44 domain-containing protein [Thermodesulfovibrio sp.]